MEKGRGGRGGGVLAGAAGGRDGCPVWLGARNGLYRERSQDAGCSELQRWVKRAGRGGTGQASGQREQCVQKAQRPGDTEPS